MKFDHPELEVSFTVKENPTRRDILLYDGAIQGRMADTMFVRLWGGVKHLVDKWMPEYDEKGKLKNEADKSLAGYLAPLDLDLDEVGTDEQLKIIKWAGLAVFSYREQLDLSNPKKVK